MFHNSSSSSTFGTMNNRMTMTPGPSRSRSLMHNDENAMNMNHMNGMSHKKKKSGGLGLGGGKGGGGGLKSRTSNSNSNIMNSNNAGGTTKTPMNKSLSTSKSTTSGRRRALGDISNRKGARGSGNGAGKENTGGLSAHTPHKNKQIQIQQIKTNKPKTVKKKQGLSQHNATTLKKKTVSFSIHTSEEANHDTMNVVPAPAPAPISSKNKTKSTSTSKSVQKAKSRQRQDRVYEDIEVSAGRTWLEEQELLGEETFSLADLSIDVQGTLDDIATMEENDRAMMDRERAARTEEYEESLRQGELMDLQVMKELEECPIFEEEDDSAIAHLYAASSAIHQKADVFGGYGIYEDDDDDDDDCSLGLGLELGLGLDDDDLNSIGDDLIADIDDISI